MKKYIVIFITMCVIISQSICYVDAGTEDLRGNFIDKDMATTIAMIFVYSNYEKNDWDRTVYVEKVTELYGPDDDIIAYSIRLRNEMTSQGYVTVSAWTGCSLIMEFSQNAVPLYMEFDCSKVYYLGGVAYTNSKESAEDIGSQIEYSHDMSNRNIDFINTIESKTVPSFTMWQLGFTASSAITDPISYLNSTYGALRYTVALYSKLSSSQLYGYTILEDNACSVYAIAACIYANKGVITGDDTLTFSAIKNECLSTGANLGYYTSLSGVEFYNIDNLAEAVLEDYGSDWSSSNYYANSFNNCKTEIDSGRVAIMNIAFGYYGDHSVSVIGYQTYFDTEPYYYYFLRIKDGWSTGDRFVCTNGLQIDSVTKIKP